MTETNNEGQRTETKSNKTETYKKKDLWHSFLVYTQNNIAFKTQPLSVIVVLSRYIFTAFKYQIYSFNDVFTLLLTSNVPKVRDILLTLIIVLFKSTNFTENNSPSLVGGGLQDMQKDLIEGQGRELGLKQGLLLVETSWRSCHSHSQSHMHSSLIFETSGTILYSYLVHIKA